MIILLGLRETVTLCVHVTPVDILREVRRGEGKLDGTPLGSGTLPGKTPYYQYGNM